MSAIMISYNPFVVSRGIDGMPASGSVTCVRTEFAVAAIAQVGLLAWKNLKL